LLALFVAPNVLACAHAPPVKLQPDNRQLGCFELHLDLSATQKRMLYVDRAPTFVELRPEHSAFPLRHGLVVRSLPYAAAESGPSGVWHPIENGGIAFDWGTGFAGFAVAFGRSGPKYVGRAETYADVASVPVESFAASLEPVPCGRNFLLLPGVVGIAGCHQAIPPVASRPVFRVPRAVPGG
jgi:hypothetical protein